MKAAVIASLRFVLAEKEPGDWQPERVVIDPDRESNWSPDAWEVLLAAARAAEAVWLANPEEPKA